MQVDVTVREVRILENVHDAVRTALRTGRGATRLTVDDGYQLRMLSFKMSQCLWYRRVLLPRTDNDPERIVAPCCASTVSGCRRVRDSEHESVPLSERDTRRSTGGPP